MRMINMNELPKGYKQIRRVNLEKDKVFIIINLLAIIIFIIMFFLGVMFNPINFIVDKKFFSYLCLIFFLLVIYMLIHVAIHGYFMKNFSGEKARYGFKGFCAYAGSDSYFHKKHYIIIALSPVVILGIILLIINIIAPQSYFWVVQFIQMENITGGVGDYYITYIMSKMPDDTLTQDTGVSMVMYLK